MSDNNPKLMPLRIQAGWAVTHNRFYDIDPKPGDEEILENWGYFVEDIIQIRRLKLANGEWSVFQKGALIDLGWYPDSSPKGEYTLRLIENCEWEFPQKEFSSKNRFEIATMMEEWMLRDHGAL